MMQLFYRTALLFVLLMMSPAMIWASLLDDGIESFDQKDYQLAYERLLPLAEQGNGEAQYYIGGMLVEGMGIPADPAKGVYWLEQSVNNQYYMAAKMLGSMYLSGFGVPMDTQKGAKYIILFERLVPKDDVDSGCD